MADGDARYLKRKVKAGRLDVHPTEKALVVNYELEATILGELGDPMLGDRKECQKIIRLKSLNAQTDITALAKEVINKCKLIHPSKLPEVEQLLYYLQKRKDSETRKTAKGSRDAKPGGEGQLPPDHEVGEHKDPSLAQRTSSAKDMSSSSSSSMSEATAARVHSASLHRYSPVDLEAVVANINDLEDYIELLYEDERSKVKGSGLILQLARNPDNLEELSQNETLLGALSRVLREDWRASAVDLSTNIVYVFFCFSTFRQFHPVIAYYKVGSLVLDIVDYEIGRYFKQAKILQQQMAAAVSTGSAASAPPGQTAAEQHQNQFQAFVSRQEQLLRVSIYLLLNLSERPEVEEKMKRRGIVRSLVALLERKNAELLILVMSFLKKMSCYLTNKEEMKEAGVVEMLAPLLSAPDQKQPKQSAASGDLANSVLRLLLNLSFDPEMRNRMVKAGMLPKLVALLTSCAGSGAGQSSDPQVTNATTSAAARLQNPACCVLYHLSIDDKVKSMFTYTDCIPAVMRMILDPAPSSSFSRVDGPQQALRQRQQSQVELEVIALGVNLAANRRNAQLICEGHGLRMLMQRAFHYQDALVLKMIRNIAQHEDQTIKAHFIEFIGDIADAVQRADSEDFVVECVGILGNLTIPDLDFERLLKEYDLLPWMKARLAKTAARALLVRTRQRQRRRRRQQKAQLGPSAEAGAADIDDDEEVDGGDDEDEDLLLDGDDDDDDLDEGDEDPDEGGRADDLILEIVVFLGTCCATDPSAALYICRQNMVECLIDLLKAKQEDDEMVLQVVYVFHRLCAHEATRKFVVKDSDAVAYIIDLMHDKNPEVQRVCDRTLDVISQFDDSWSERVKREKFRFHNAQWLEIVQSQWHQGQQRLQDQGQLQQQQQQRRHPNPAAADPLNASSTSADFNYECIDLDCSDFEDYGHDDDGLDHRRVVGDDDHDPEGGSRRFLTGAGSDDFLSFDDDDGDEFEQLLRSSDTQN